MGLFDRLTGNKPFELKAEYIPTDEELAQSYKQGNMSQNEYVDVMNKRLENANKQLDRELVGNLAKEGLRAGIGAALEGASFHPVLNIPYVGTGLGGALFEMGNSIQNKESALDTLKNMGKGFVIGETVGAIPHAGKGINKASGGRIGEGVSNLYGKLMDTPVGQKVGEYGSKLGDLLLTDIKGFNPNKQTVYHGSPYDFEKFSNDAIGTGEGAQAHGMGHYAAKSKDVADIRYRKSLTGDDFDNMKYYYKNQLIEDKKQKAILSTILENGKDKVISVREKSLPRYKYDKKEYEEKLKELNFIKSINENLIRKDTNKGQLYKLLIPKDDVMLREDLPFSEQPKAVQEALKKLANTYNDTFDSDIILQSINKNKTGKQIYKNLEFELSPDWQAAGEELYNNGIKGISYNGGMDGEANVIFNPNDIDIVRKYYNQPEAIEYLKSINPNVGAEVEAIANVLIDKKN